MEGEALDRKYPLLHTPVSSEILLRYGTIESLSQPTKTTSCLSSSTCSTLTQLWACTGKYLCMLNVGLVASLPVLLIPLAASGSFHISLSDGDIQNLVSIIYIVMPVGSLLAALPIKMTRKPPIIMTQAIMAASWIGMYFSTEPWHLLTARAFGGIAMTLSQPHVACYIGEVTVPKLRGIFGSLTQTTGIIGALVMTCLTYLHSWHLPIIICCSFAFLSMLYLFTIPESPILLIDYEDYNQAFKSLRKLRGWKWGDEKEIMDEFQQLVSIYSQKGENIQVVFEHLNKSINGNDNYAFKPDNEKPELQEHIQHIFLKNSTKNSFDSWESQKNPKILDSRGESGYPTILPTEDFSSIDVYGENNIKSHESLPVKETANDSETLLKADDVSCLRFFLMPTMYKPLLILGVSACFMVGPGSHCMNSYLQYILADYQLTSSYNLILTLITVSMLAGNITSTCLVAVVGKRRIILISTVGAGLGYIALAVVTQDYQLHANLRLILVASFLAWTIFMEEFGVRTLYHSLLSELFPMRGKKIGTSLIVLVLCINGVVMGEEFPQLLSACGLLGIMSINVGLCFFGALFFFFMLIETEGKTLKEIEDSF